jgi:hypothetical protein
MSSGGERGGSGSSSSSSSAPTPEERCALAVAFLRASARNGRFDQVALSQLRRATLQSCACRAGFRGLRTFANAMPCLRVCAQRHKR